MSLSPCPNRPLRPHSLLVKQASTARSSPPPDGQLMSIMLRELRSHSGVRTPSAEPEGQAGGPGAGEPLYTIADAEAALELVTTCEYDELVDLCEGVRLRFVDGAICWAPPLWSWAHGGTGHQKDFFFPAPGNRDQPIIRDPIHRRGRLRGHGEHLRRPSPLGAGELYRGSGRHHRRDLCPGGNVIIPPSPWAAPRAFVLHREMKERGLVRTHPDFPVCVDSPWPTRPPGSSPATCMAIWTRRH
jgi:metallo-beta-lactamase family protein